MKGHMSASGIKKHRTCPKQWEYRYESDFEPVDGDTRYLDLGSAVHEAIETGLKAEPGEEYNIAVMAYPRKVEEHGVVDDMREDGMDYVKRGIEYATGREEDILDIEAEETFRIDRPDVDTEVKAKIDVATESEIWDWKTGSIRDDTPTDEKIQGAVYMGAYRVLYGRPPEKIRFIYLKEEQVRTLEPTDEVWGEMLVHARRLVNSKQSEEFPADPGDHCHWCDYQQYCPEGGGIGANFDWQKWRAL